MNINEQEKLSENFEKYISLYNKEVLENLDEKSNNNNEVDIDKQNRIFLENLDHSNGINEEEKNFYDENKDFDIFKKVIIPDEIQQNKDIDHKVFELDDFYNINNIVLSKSNCDKTNNFVKRSSMTVSDLTDESKLRKSICIVEELNKNNYIEIKDWDFNNPENINNLDDNFKEFEKKFFSNF